MIIKISYEVIYWTHYLDVSVAMNSFCQNTNMEESMFFHQKYFVNRESELLYTEIHTHILS